MLVTLRLALIVPLPTAVVLVTEVAAPVVTTGGGEPVRKVPVFEVSVLLLCVAVKRKSYDVLAVRPLTEHVTGLWSRPAGRVEGDAATSGSR
jgi:hypothetical protein